MKIRIQNNTLRIRLNEQEVKMLQQETELNSITSFPGNKLIITLKSALENFADFSEGKILIRVQQEQVNHWASSEDVTIALDFALPNDEKLSILVEKDMKI